MLFTIKSSKHIVLGGSWYKYPPMTSQGHPPPNMRKNKGSFGFQVRTSMARKTKKHIMQVRSSYLDSWFFWACWTLRFHILFGYRYKSQTILDMMIRWLIIMYTIDLQYIHERIYQDIIYFLSFSVYVYLFVIFCYKPPRVQKIHLFMPGIYK